MKDKYAKRSRIAEAKTREVAQLAPCFGITSMVTLPPETGPVNPLS